MGNTHFLLSRPPGVSLSSSETVASRLWGESKRLAKLRASNFLGRAPRLTLSLRIRLGRLRLSNSGVLCLVFLAALCGTPAALCSNSLSPAALCSGQAHMLTAAAAAALASFGSMPSRLRTAATSSTLNWPKLNRWVRETTVGRRTSGRDVTRIKSEESGGSSSVLSRAF